MEPSTSATAPRVDGAKASKQQVLSIQYADFSEWQRKCLQGKVVEEQLKYWKIQLAGTSHGHQHHGKKRILQIPLGTIPIDRLRNLSQRHNATLYMTLLAAFQTLQREKWAV